MQDEAASCMWLVLLLIHDGCRRRSSIILITANDQISGIHVLRFCAYVTAS